MKKIIAIMNVKLCPNYTYNRTKESIQKHKCSENASDHCDRLNKYDNLSFGSIV